MSSACPLTVSYGEGSALEICSSCPFILLIGDSMHRIPLALTLTAALALTACQQQTPTAQLPLSAQDIGVSTSAPTNQNIDVTSNGAVSVGGQKIFPIGFYYVPYGLTNSTILNDLGKIKSAGFNIVHINQRTSEPDERDFLYTYLNSARTLSSPYNQKMYVAIGDLTYNATNNTCSNTDSPAVEATTTTAAATPAAAATLAPATARPRPLP